MEGEHRKAYENIVLQMKNDSESFERIDIFDYCVEEEDSDLGDNDTANELHNNVEEWGNVIDCV